MDGYSVNEAAAVLGIPEGRVWELLARGVLSGTTEVGGDMRVFLRGTALTEAAQTNGGTHRANGGNGGTLEPSAEITAFRELLTELRNLTERYGQALLALGEARGEVVSLRGRVDLLEARLENRAPWPESTPATTWHSAPAPEIPAGMEQGATAESPAWPATEPAPPATPEPEPEAVIEPEPVAAEVVSAAEVEAAIESEAAGEAEPIPEPVSEPGPEPLTEPKPVAAEVVSAAEVEAAIESEAAAEAEPSLDIEGLPEIEPPEADLASISEIPAEAAIEAAPEPTGEAPAEEEVPAEPEPHRSNHGRARAAIAGFAAALARAEDPTTAEVSSGDEPLPGTDELADAVAAYQRDIETDTEERGGPSEAVATADEHAAAEAFPVEEPVPAVRPGYSTETPEPDWIAEEDLIVPAGSVPDRADRWNREEVLATTEPEPVAGEPEPEAVRPEPVAVEPEPVAEEPSFTADAVSEPIDADEEAESLAAETAASEIAAAFDPWPLHDEDARAEGTPSRDTTAVSSPAESDEETTAEIAAPAPAEIDEAAEEVAAETAAAEIAAAFDAWPLHEDDEDTAGAPSAEAELAMAPDRAEPEPVHDVAEPTAYAGIPIETDEAGDAWGLAAAGFTPAPEPTAEPTVEESPATWPAEDREKAAEEATDQPGAEPGGEPSEGPAAEPPPWGRVPVEIAAEPPAADDAALLRASEPVAAFAEPPILPQEPAFWEPGARARAPFAMPQAEPWEPAPTEAAPIETSSPPAELPPSNSPPTSPPPTPSVKPSASGPNPSSPPAKPRPPVARRKRGPAARAIRRLRYLID